MAISEIENCVGSAQRSLQQMDRHIETIESTLRCLKLERGSLFLDMQRLGEQIQKTKATNASILNLLSAKDLAK